MQDATYLLYRFVRKEFPLKLDPFEQYVADTVQELKKKVNGFPDEYKSVISELLDSHTTLADLKAYHMFTLGLDLGLSIMEELRPYPDML